MTTHLRARIAEFRSRCGHRLFEAEVDFEVWEAGSIVDIEWNAPFRVISVWFAKQTLYSATSSSFELQRSSTASAPSLASDAAWWTVVRHTADVYSRRLILTFVGLRP